MKMPVLVTIIFSVCGLIAFCWTSTSSAQQTQPTNITVQLPTVSFFNIRTVVSAPDAGVMKLGGVSRNGSGSTVYGSGPAWVRPFRNRGLGGWNSAGNAGVKARVIINSEIEEDLMAANEKNRHTREIVDPNGSPAVQQKADFLSRHMGKNR